MIVNSTRTRFSRLPRSLWGLAASLLAGCFGVRIGAGPNVDTLGHVGFDVKVQVHLEIPFDPKTGGLDMFDKGILFVGPAAAFGGGASNRRDLAATNAVTGHILGYAGLGFNYVHLHADRRRMMHRMSILGGKRLLFGYTDSEAVGALALQYSPMFLVSQVDASRMFLIGPELQAEVLFERTVDGAQHLAVFSLPLVAEFYGPLRGERHHPAPPARSRDR